MKTVLVTAKRASTWSAQPPARPDGEAHQYLRLIVSIEWSIGYGALCRDIILKEAQLVFWKCKKS